MNMNTTNYSLFLKNTTYYIPKKKHIIVAVSEKVANELLLHNQYTVISDVSPQVFKSFLEYWKDQKTELEINPTNFYEYQSLSNEFEMMQKILSQRKQDPSFNISCLLDPIYPHKYLIEQEISMKLDEYLSHHQTEMYSIPIQSLYNIFNNSNRVLNNHSAAYQFITHAFDQSKSANDDHLFILLDSLDCNKLYEESPELFNEAFSKSKNHFGYRPSINSFIVSDMEKKNDIIQKHELYDLVSKGRFDEMRNKIITDQIAFIKLPKTLTEIPDAAFFECRCIKECIASDNLKKIGTHAFYGCTSLVGVFVPSSVELIGQGAFSGCSKLKKIKIPDSLEFISEFTFETCKLEGILEIPNGIKTIKSCAFHVCNKIEKLIIPKSVNTIENWVFFGCSALKEVVLPSTIKELAVGLFQGCTSLSKIVIPNSVTTIKNSCFNSCKSLKTISIPTSVISIGASCFANCSSLVEITIPDSIKLLPNGLFEDCISLEEVILPKEIQSIPDNAFKNCSKMKHINIPPSVTKIYHYAFDSCESLEKINIPNVTHIENGGFCNCSHLNHVDFPNIRYLGCDVFQNCPSLKEIEFPYFSDSRLRYGCFNNKTKVKLVKK